MTAVLEVFSSKEIPRRVASQIAMPPISQRNGRSDERFTAWADVNGEAA